MSALLILAVAISCFVLGVLALGALLWLWPADGASAAHERREEERRLQRLTHAAMAQMLAEVRAERAGGDPWQRS